MNLIESPSPAVIFSCICKFCKWTFEITDGLSSPTAYIKFDNEDDTETKFLESPATFSGKGILMEKIEAPLKEINKNRRTDRTAKKDFFLFPIALLSEDMIFLKDSWFCVHGFCIVEKAEIDGITAPPLDGITATARNHRTAARRSKSTMVQWFRRP
ncbi:hypothetical protein E3N88_45003 [Mikania micrantha]|uniref:Uncharacterized protein n=1 Tax=Mikania micrantha TaxID=192012 RepID=A0A5N6LAD3_9ASTR|nr:hypothetical protein E3N88_45003 [Mikania micrantha]